MTQERCYYCARPATHADSVPDADQRGYNLNESGYKTIYLCVAHALEARKSNLSRVEEIREVVK